MGKIPLVDLRLHRSKTSAKIGAARSDAKNQSLRVEGPAWTCPCGLVRWDIQIDKRHSGSSLLSEVIMVWALFRVVLFGGSFLIGLFFFGPAAPVHAKNETAISISHKKHKKEKWGRLPISPFVFENGEIGRRPHFSTLTVSPTSGARGYGRSSTPM